MKCFTLYPSLTFAGLADALGQFKETFGAIMLSAAVEIVFLNSSESIPAFLTVAAMVLTYSVSDGIMWGIIGSAGIHLFAGRGREAHWVVYVFSALFIAKYALI